MRFELKKYYIITCLSNIVVYTPQNDQSIGHPTKFIEIQTVQFTLVVFKVNIKKKNEVSPPSEKSHILLNQASTPAPKEGLMFVSSVVKS